MDFGLAGKGFFVVSGPSGPLYTRSGNFQILPSGKLATLEGYPVLGQDGQSITADVNQPIEVLQDGTIRQNGQDLAQLQLANFNDTSILTKQGNNYFRSTTDQKPVDPTDLKVYQGKVEAANVGAAQSAVRLVGLTRQFEMMQKALSISSDMSREAIEQVAKI
jgi:flagellar basal body rod protein FlgG